MPTSPVELIITRPTEFGALARLTSVTELLTRLDNIKPSRQAQALANVVHHLPKTRPEWRGLGIRSSAVDLTFDAQRLVVAAASTDHKRTEKFCTLITGDSVINLPKAKRVTLLAAALRNPGRDPAAEEPLRTLLGTGFTAVDNKKLDMARRNPIGPEFTPDIEIQTQSLSL